MTPYQRMFEDAMIEEDWKGNLEEAHFGSCIVENHTSGTLANYNILVFMACTYDEAVGMAYQGVIKKYVNKKPASLLSLKIEKGTVWLDFNRASSDIILG